MNRETYDQFSTFEYRGSEVTRAPRYVLIEYEGMVYDPDSRPDRPGWAHEWGTLTPEAAAERREILADGTFWRDAERLSPAQTNYERAKILRTYDGLSSAFASRPSGAVRPYIPGLWHHQSVPMLGGPPKVGKSLLVCDLAAALVIAGRQFLDHFEPVNVTPEERARPIVLVNAENPEADMHEALLATGLEYDAVGDPYPFYLDPDDDGTGSMLFVVHLEVAGGADTFDLTKQDVYDRWEFELLGLARVAGPPLTLIVDGVTAILNSDTTRYGRWYSEFRRLLKSVDVPNGLPTGHTGMKNGYLMNGVESMAGQDGLWTYDASEPYVNPRAQRRFRTVPRLHAPAIDPTPVVMGEDGRLRLDPSGATRDRAQDAQPTPDDKRRYLRDQIAALSAARQDTFTKAVCGTGEAYTEYAAILRQMEQDGEVRKERKGQGFVWSLITPEPD
jgi:hypothetical protein